MKIASVADLKARLSAYLKKMPGGAGGGRPKQQSGRRAGGSPSRGRRGRAGYLGDSVKRKEQ
jgi:hypothetical protein